MSDYPPGYPGNLTASQTKKLDQFKANIQDIWRERFDDMFCCRWLRAREWDLKKAEKMVREAMEWRRRYNVDTVTTDWEIPEVLKKYSAGGSPGFDKQGGPLWVDCLGKVDLKTFFLAAKKSDMLKYRVYWLETMRISLEENNAKTGKKAYNGIAIFDMDGIGPKHLWKPGLEVVIEILKILEAYYPESLRTAYVIHAPAIFPVMWNLVKPFLSEATKKKIDVLGSNWKNKLREVIDPDQFPEHWGGSQKGEDGSPYGSVAVGGKIPESYFITKEFVDHSKFTSISVQRSKAIELDYDVQAGHALSWQFWTEGSDIGFGVFRRNEDGKPPEEVVPLERRNTHMVPEFDSITCEKTGVYFLKFDNSYSWVTGKNLSYFVEVLEPDLEVYNTHL